MREPVHRRAGALWQSGYQTARRAEDRVPDCDGSEPCPGRCHNRWCRPCRWWEETALEAEIQILYQSRFLNAGVFGWSAGVKLSSSPVSIEREVVFPAPLCPSRTVIWLSNMFIVRSFTACRILFPTLNSCREQWLQIYTAWVSISCTHFQYVDRYSPHCPFRCSPYRGV